MKRKQIFFTAPGKAELWERDVEAVKEDQVLVRMEYTVISGGTERACLLNMNNTTVNYPESLGGYAGVGYVEDIGPDVKTVCIGDRVLVYHGNHASYNIRREADITKVEDDEMDSLDAA